MEPAASPRVTREGTGGVATTRPPVLTPVQNPPSDRRELPPRNGRTRRAGVIRRLVVGRARPSAHLEHTLLPRFL
ncbi:MAG TPA: hypothetical protein VEM41_09145, partial [Actinomycetota bacterium]|nr:hypothetical protein [Actinomycetota bacterium]